MKIPRIFETLSNTFTSDGAWCWFGDPKAIYFEGTVLLTECWFKYWVLRIEYWTEFWVLNVDYLVSAVDANWDRDRFCLGLGIDGHERIFFSD